MPAQTRGFLFSDLRGYSAFTDRHGDRAARDLLARYRRIVRDAISQFSGSEIRTEGDSFYVVFDSVSAAVEAGLAIQERLAAGDARQPIHAGIGIHAGEVEDDAEQGIVSSAVNIAARICAVAETGEVLASETVRALTRTYLDVTFVPRGRRRLKGISDPVHVYAVQSDPAMASRVGGVRVLAAAAAMLGLVVVAILAISAMGQALADAENATAPSASVASGSMAADPTASIGSAPTSDVDAFPNAAEQELFGRLASEFSDRCVRADEDEIPEAPPLAYTYTPLLTRAAIRCHVADDLNVFFYLASGPTATLEVLHYHAGRLGIENRDCSGDRPGVEEWSFGPASGWVLCSKDAFWTYDRTPILGHAVGTDMETTMDWWRDHARFPARDE